jgi:hypothetical protein
MNYFTITVSTDHQDAESLVGRAFDILASELGKEGDATSYVTVVQLESPAVIPSDATFIDGVNIEPGQFD